MPKIKRLLLIHKISECPEEFFNEAWLRLTTDRMEITVDGILKVSRDLILKQKRSCFKASTNLTTKFCPRCKNDLPAGCFKLVSNKNFNHKILYAYCRECEASYMKSYREANGKKLGKHTRRVLGDGYIRGYLIRTGTAKNLITKHMIVETRDRIKEKRFKKSTCRLYNGVNY